MLSDLLCMLNQLLQHDCVISDTTLCIYYILFNTVLYCFTVSLPKIAVIELFGQENTELAICYKVHGAENKIYNLVSDMCVSVNAHLTLASNPKVGNIMSRIGVMAMDNEGKCNQIEADLYHRTLVHNGQAVEGRKQHKGILLTKMRDRARISVPNCKGQSVVFWVIYHYHNGADMIVDCVSAICILLG